MSEGAELRQSRITSAEYRREVGVRLRLARRALGMTSRALSSQMEVKLPRWSQWENGHHLPDIRVMVRLYRRHQISLDYIFDGNESNLPKWLFEAIRALLPSPEEPP